MRRMGSAKTPVWGGGRCVFRLIDMSMHADTIEIVEGFRARTPLPGVAVAVVAGEESFTAVAGDRRAFEGLAVSERTVFSIASCSKAFTAKIVAQLAKEKVLGLEDKIQKHLPELRLYDPWIAAEITVRDLLGMRSGLGRIGICEWGADARVTPAEIATRLAHTAPVAGFRERYTYTNWAYHMLAEIVERLTRAPFTRVLSERVFQPLGMTDALLHEGSLAGVTDHASPHATWEGLLALDARCGGRKGESCLYLSARDACTWLQHVLSGEHDSLLFEPLSLGRADSRYGQSFLHYAMGWEDCDYFGARIFCHEGGEFGASSRTMVDLARGVAVAVYVNARTLAVRSLALSVFDRIVGRTHRDWLSDTEAWGAAPAPDAVGFESQRGEAFPHKIEHFIGAYTSAANGRLDVSVGGGETPIMRFEDASVMDGQLIHEGGEIFSVDPCYPGMGDIARGRGRARLDLDERRPRVHVHGLGAFIAP